VTVSSRTFGFVYECDGRSVFAELGAIPESGWLGRVPFFLSASPTIANPQQVRRIADAIITTDTVGEGRSYRYGAVSAPDILGRFRPGALNRRTRQQVRPDGPSLFAGRGPPEGGEFALLASPVFLDTAGSTGPF
jgi:hypothetical protein